MQPSFPIVILSLLKGLKKYLKSTEPNRSGPWLRYFPSLISTPVPTRMLLREPKICEICKLNISGATLSREIRYFFADLSAIKARHSSTIYRQNLSPKTVTPPFPPWRPKWAFCPQKRSQMPSIMNRVVGDKLLI